VLLLTVPRLGLPPARPLALVLERLPLGLLERRRAHKGVQVVVVPFVVARVVLIVLVVVVVVVEVVLLVGAVARGRA